MAGRRPRLRRSYRPGPAALAAGLCIAVLLSVAARAQQILDHIETKPAQIIVHFTVPMQYVSHSPEANGDELRIQLRSVVTLPGDERNAEESVSWQSTQGIPLTDVTLEAGAGNDQLVVRFDRPISYRVESSAGQRAITIHLVKDTPADSRPAPPSTAAANQRDDEDALELGVTRITEDPDLQPRVSFPGPSAAPIPEGDLARMIEELRQAKANRPAESGQPATADDPLAALMEEARQAVASGDLPRAIQLYTKVLQSPDSEYARDAQEFLGLARERNGQIAHAKMEYEKYLAMYPDGDGALRVRQRLDGILTATNPAKDKLRVADGRPPVTWDLYGGVSQMYRRNELSLQFADQRQDIVSLSGLFSDVDVTARRRSTGYDIRTRLTAGYISDFLDEGSGDQTQVSSAYIDVVDLKRNISGRLGRQSMSTGGVLGRFDGLQVGYKISDWSRVNVVAGYPVDFSIDGFDSSRQLYGFNFELGTFGGAWDFIPFVVAQNADGVADRQAVGIETRYFSERGSLLSLVDYDILYSELNNILVLASWRLPAEFTVNANVDIRKAPVLTTRNALIGQPLTSLDQMLLNFTEEELRQLAIDRTLESESYTLGVSKPITERFQLNADVTMASLSGTQTSGGVEAIPPTDNELYYNLQLIGTGLLMENDIAIFGLRYSDATTAQTTSFTVNARYPFGRDWRINPRLRVDHRVTTADALVQWLFAPSIRIDYRMRNNFRIELETGWQTADIETLTGQENTAGYFLNLGYRADF